MLALDLFEPSASFVFFRRADEREHFERSRWTVMRAAQKILKNESQPTRSRWVGFQAGRWVTDPQNNNNNNKNNGVHY